jgi:hypothetical protein
MSRPRSKTLKVTQLQQFGAGLQKRFAGQTLPINGGTITVAQLLAKIDAYIALIAAAIAGKAAWQVQLTAVDTAATELDPLIDSAHTYVRGVLGAANPGLAEFGLAPRKQVARTAEAQVVVNAKSKATRTARNTLGPKAKKAIHGTVAAAQAPATVKPGGDSTK